MSENEMPREIFAYKLKVDTGATVYGWERSLKTGTTSYTRTDTIRDHTALLKQARDMIVRCRHRSLVGHPVQIDWRGDADKITDAIDAVLSGEKK